MKPFNGKSPEEIRDILKNVNQWLEIVQMASKKAADEAAKLNEKSKPELRIVR